MKDLMTIQRKYLTIAYAASCQLMVILMLVSIGMADASAQTEATLDQLFTIKDVKVDEIARSAAQARQAALLKAEENAYNKLIRKITQAEHRDRLPELSTTQRQNLISGIELVDELSSNRRYVATLNVRFSPSIVSDFLAEYDVPHVLGTGNDILVLHAHERGFSRTLWERDAIMEKAREEVDWANRIRGYRFARGEIKERISISVDEIAAFDTDAALSIGELNALNSVLMISSSVEQDDKGAKVIEYSYLATDSGMSGSGVTPFPASGEIDSVVQDMPPEAQALIAMYDSVLDEIDGAWRERLLVDTGEQGTIDVLVAATSLKNMAAYERVLSEISLVQDYTITEIGIPISRFSITYTGRQDQLVQALHFAGLELRPYGQQMLLEQR